ncbi:hypothetical protein FOL46_008662 [Perkinsus olseni]|uniref:Uncharacterized protein n=1 Tax=Perkinsus olseni TaxID=32597 RepID=A0A7J6L5W4_PEROL|nr:hypothetical protein FOL46_008662 [Perkinsus olseni]
MDWLEPPQPRNDSEWIGIFTLECDNLGTSEEISDMIEFKRQEFDEEQPWLYFSWSLDEIPKSLEALRAWVLECRSCDVDLRYHDGDADVIVFNRRLQRVSFILNGTLMTLDRGRCPNDTNVDISGLAPSEGYDIGHWSDGSVASQVALVPRDE